MIETVFWFKVFVHWKLKSLSQFPKSGHDESYRPHEGSGVNFCAAGLLEPLPHQL